MTTLLEALREKEKDNAPWLYACYRLGHFVDEKGLCYCCLRVVPKRLDRSGVEELLRMFEDAWNEEHDERITSAQFYDRYTRGEIDSMFAMAWASYYEAFRRHSQRRPIFARELLSKLGVERAGFEVQRQAVRAWLAENTASKALVRSLHRAGLLDAEET